jgi:hypothetical protein
MAQIGLFLCEFGLQCAYVRADVAAGFRGLPYRFEAKRRSGQQLGNAVVEIARERQPGAGRCGLFGHAQQAFPLHGGRDVRPIRSAVSRSSTHKPGTPWAKMTP